MSESTINRKTTSVEIHQNSFLNLLHNRSLDVGLVVRVIFEECILVILFAVLASIADYFLFPICLRHRSSPWLALCPLGSFIIVAAIRPIEYKLLKIICPEHQDDIVTQRNLTSPLIRLLRIVWNIMFLGWLLILNTFSPSSLFYQADKTPNGFILNLNKLEPPIVQHVMFSIFLFVKKCHGSCATVLIFRIYIELAILAVDCIGGIEAEADTTLDEGKPLDANHEEQNPLWDINANDTTMDSLNANTLPGEVQNHGTFFQKGFQSMNPDIDRFPSHQ